MSELYGPDEELQSEKVEAGTLEGDFLGVIGKTYKRERKKRTSMVTDILLVQQVNESGSMVRKIMDVVKSPDGSTFEIKFIEKDGKKKTFGVMISHSMPNPNEDDSDGAKNFFGHNKRVFARALGGYNEETQTVVWDKVREAAGTMISFTLEERDGYSNVVPKSVNVYPKAKVSVESIVTVYRTLEAEKMARDAAKNNTPSSPASSEEPPF